MKKLLAVLVLLVSLTLTAQTTIDLSGMTDDVTLGQNCSSSQTPEQYVTTGDVNLNGFELDLRNVILVINGNLNGDGEIEGCGQSSLCVSGSIQNDPEIEDVSVVECSSLSDAEFNTKPLFSLNLRTKTIEITDSEFIRVYSMSGQLLLETNGTILNFSALGDGIYIFQSNNFVKRIPVLTF